MRRSTKIVLLVVAACLITGGTAFGVLLFATWGTLDYEKSYYYNPSIPSSIERININCEIGTVIINYNNTPTNYYAQVDLDIHIEGILVKGSSFSDFFYPVDWDNTTSGVTSFTLDAKATTWLIFGFLQQITVNLTLRTDVIYDLNTLATTGAIFMNVPDNTILNNTQLRTTTGYISLEVAKSTTFQGNVGLSTTTGSVDLKARQANFTQNLIAIVTTGDMVLNFSNCIIGGDFIGAVTTGDLTYSSYNMEYAEGHSWTLGTTTGDVFVTILQYTDMKANVTGSIVVTTGSIYIYYRDNLASVGAEFTCSIITGSNSYIPIGSGGFNEVGTNPKTITSSDYGTATYKYTFTASTITGSTQVQGESL